MLTCCSYTFAPQTHTHSKRLVLRPQKPRFAFGTVPVAAAAPASGPRSSYTTMGRPFVEYLDSSSSGRVYSCRLCHRAIADAGDVLSKDFHSKNGRAYLLRHAVNLGMGPPEDRKMTSGLHTVCDIHCTGCLYTLGWKYLFAFEASQKWKEGKFILERVKVVDATEVAKDLRRQRELAAATAAANASSGSGSLLGSSSGSGSESVAATAGLLRMAGQREHVLESAERQLWDGPSDDDSMDHDTYETESGEEQ